jgi:hypothetical protein
MFCKSIQEQLGPQAESIRSRVDLLTTSVKESRAEKRLGARAPPSGGMSETELGATQLHLRRIGQEAALARAAVLGEMFHCYSLS